MRKTFFVIIAIISIIALSHFPVLSHSGGTDSKGGHYNRSTGEYHYHHGLPAHDHEDGVCPYSPSSKSNDSQSDKDGNNTWLIFIPLAALAFFILYSKRKSKKDVHQSAIAHEDFPDSVLQPPQIREATDDNRRENVISYDTSMIPSYIAIDENLLPYMVSRQYGYGKYFNAFITPHSHCYHTSKCPSVKGKKKTVIHRYIAMNKYKPCSLCSPKNFIEDWYVEFLKKNSIIKYEIPTITKNSSENNSCEQLTLFDD